LLEGFGEALYQRFAPARFKEAFWALRDRLGESFDSIQIYTVDPVLPWELMRPHRDSEQAGFLGAAVRLGRWHIGSDGASSNALPRWSS
jgi:hypothetical protein